MLFCSLISIPMSFVSVFKAEIYNNRLKNILSTVPKFPAWSEVLDNADEDEIDQIKVSHSYNQHWYFSLDIDKFGLNRFQ